MTTHVIAEHPGYSWVWDGAAWMLNWEVLPSVYSPPSLFPMIRKVTYQVPDASIMGRVIGKNGHHFKNITHLSGVLYIYCRDSEIEIWGYENTPETAMWMVDNHVRSLRMRTKRARPRPLPQLSDWIVSA
jgi:hypothetical protein